SHPAISTLSLHDALPILPHLLWQARHGWPTLEFMRNATARKMVAVPFGKFALGQILEMGPGNAPIWVAGLAFGLLRDPARRGRRSEEHTSELQSRFDLVW